MLGGEHFRKRPVRDPVRTGVDLGYELLEPAPSNYRHLKTEP